MYLLHDVASAYDGVARTMYLLHDVASAYDGVARTMYLLHDVASAYDGVARTMYLLHDVASAYDGVARTMYLLHDVASAYDGVARTMYLLHDVASAYDGVARTMYLLHDVASAYDGVARTMYLLHDVASAYDGVARTMYLLHDVASAYENWRVRKSSHPTQLPVATYAGSRFSHAFYGGKINYACLKRIFSQFSPLSSAPVHGSPFPSPLRTFDHDESIVYVIAYKTTNENLFNPCEINLKWHFCEVICLTKLKYGKSEQCQNQGFYQHHP